MNLMKSTLTWVATGVLAMAAFSAPASTAPSRTQPADEVFYQIFERSFRDSNGDRIGDLKGLTSQLDYLKQLGITSILLTPLQPSPYYHNYFATDFRAIEPAYGSMDDYFAFVRAAHRLPAVARSGASHRRTVPRPRHLGRL